MNQILVSEKLYITPEIKRKKRFYKLEFFLSVFLVCLLFSYYIYAEYDRSKSEQVSQQILAQLKYDEDDTIKKADDDVIVVILDEKQEEQVEQQVESQIEEQEEQQSGASYTTGTTSSKSKKKSSIDTAVYTSTDGVKYTTESILEIPAINIKYPVLSQTSPDLLFVSLNKYWGPKPNEIGNYCIVGHYYESGKMFGKLRKLKNGDIAKLTDLTGRTIKYQVYNKYVVQPTDTSCTTQRTNGKKELTLITCTNHGKQRLVVKLREVQ